MSDTQSTNATTTRSVVTHATGVVREPGTTSVFQMPPRLIAVRGIGTPASPVARKNLAPASTPLSAPALRIPATIQGRFASSTAPITGPSQVPAPPISGMAMAFTA